MYTDGTLTENEREVLENDLKLRVPYNVKGTFIYSPEKEDCTICYAHLNNYYIFYLGLRPYLRPISSMTKEEMESYNDTWQRDTKDIWILGRELEAVYQQKAYDSVWQHPIVPQYRHVIWLIANHFDFKGLIPKGLALEAPEGMYSLNKVFAY